MSSITPLPAASPARTISLFTAICVVIADMIGTGVFTSLGFQVGALPSGFAILALWAVGGLCALCGALVYGELASALPRSGGEYNLLTEIYHPAAGFLAGWISVTVGFAAPAAVAAMAFAKYLQGTLGGIQLSSQAVAACLLLLVAGIHLCGTRTSIRFQNLTTILKVLLIVVLIGAGLLLAHPQPLAFHPQAGDWTLITSPGFARNFIYVSYAYLGWNAAIYIAGEVCDARRNVPLAVIIGTLVVTALYVLLNFAMLRAAPLGALAGHLEVTTVAAGYLFGTTAARVVSGLICAGLIATVSALTFIGPRVAMTMGEDWRMLRFLARRSQRGVPVAAIVLQSAISLLLVLTFTFDQVYNFIGFSLAVCSFFAVLGIFVLRYRRPELPRPVRAWGYPLPPLIFLGVNGWMLLDALRTQPIPSLASLGTMLAGLGVYRLSRRSPANFAPNEKPAPAAEC